MRAIVAVGEPHGERIARELVEDGAAVLARVAPEGLGTVLRESGSRVREALAEADTLVVAATRGVLTAEVVSVCDRHAVRVLALSSRGNDARLARSFGVGDALPVDSEGWRIVDAAREGISFAASRREGRVVTVWGPHGAPGRSTVATELAVELARIDGRAALVDADTHAPSLSVSLGLAEDSPGIAAACRAADDGRLSVAELTRISAPLDDAAVDVLTGLNRPSRWPELSARRLSAVLHACRAWADHTVVDVAAAIERDEEIVSDLDGPRRNAAALAALEAADVVVAVASADPVGISRLLRSHAELRALTGSTPVHIVVNRLRGGPLGVDARGQVRRTLSRYGGIEEVSFLPFDGKAADAALLSARSIGEASPRSSLSQAVRRVAKGLVVRSAGADADTRRSRRRERVVVGG